MMYKISFILSFAMLLLSCPNDDIDHVKEDDDPGMEEPMENEFLIDSFLWAVPIDSTTIRDRDEHIVRHALLYENTVLFHTPALEGWVALDATTGETVWDKRGLLNTSEIFDTPIQHGDFVYYMRTSSFLKINMANGNLELKELWPTETEFQSNFMGIDGDNIYSTVVDFNHTVPDFEAFLGIAVDDIVSPPLDWDRFNEYFAAENEDIVRGSGTPVFYTDIDGHRNMIYPSVHNTLDLITHLFNTITSYDLEADSIKWQKKVAESGAFGSDILIEEDRVYSLVDSSMICQNAETGDLLWKADPKYFNETFAFGAGVHIVGDMIVAIGRNRKNVGINKFNGRMVWFNDFDANHSDYKASGSQQFALDIYQGRIYYISGWGQLISLDPNSGSIRRYYLPDRPIIEEYDIQLFEPSFRLNGMTISDDGIIYLSEGLRFLALEVPDKDM